MSAETLVPQNAKHQPLSEADKLARDAATATQVRALTNPEDNVTTKDDDARTGATVRERVAVVVFVDAEGADVRDAHRVAERAVTTAVNAAGLSVTAPSGVVRAVEVVDVATVAAALRSGALQLVPAGGAR